MTSLNQLKEQFKNPDLFDQALTHRSWINENPGKSQSNERLEFLGDAVLELVVSHALFLALPDKEEGFLTALRANIVNTTNLANLASRLNVGESLKLSKGEKLGGGSDNTSLLANTVEAIIGALFMDQGYTSAETFITDNLLADLSVKLNSPLKDPKSRLQEAVQAKGFPAPRYKVLEESGPDHAKHFVIEVYVGDHVAAKGEGKSKNIAEQKAAEAALANLA